MKLQWLKDIIGDVYTDDMDNAAAQALGKDFVSRADFNEKAGKAKELEATVTQLNGTVKDRDKQLETLKASTGDMAALKDQIAAPVCSCRVLLRPAYLRHDLPSPHHGGT